MRRARPKESAPTDASRHPLRRVCDKQALELGLSEARSASLRDSRLLTSLWRVSGSIPTSIGMSLSRQTAERVLHRPVHRRLHAIAMQRSRTLTEWPRLGFTMVSVLQAEMQLSKRGHDSAPAGEHHASPRIVDGEAVLSCRRPPNVTSHGPAVAQATTVTGSQRSTWFLQPDLC